jgi:hypothetical protein
MGINADTYRQYGKKQIDYILGDSGRSYVVGYGNNPPTHPHHRSRCASLTVLHLLVPSASDVPIVPSRRSFHKHLLQFFNSKMHLLQPTNLSGEVVKRPL